VKVYDSVSAINIQCKQLQNKVLISELQGPRIYDLQVRAKLILNSFVNTGKLIGVLGVLWILATSHWTSIYSLQDQQSILLKEWMNNNVFYLLYRLRTQTTSLTLVLTQNQLCFFHLNKWCLTLVLCGNSFVFTGYFCMIVYAWLLRVKLCDSSSIPLINTLINTRTPIFWSVPDQVYVDTFNSQSLPLHVSISSIYFLGIIFVIFLFQKTLLLLTSLFTGSRTCLNLLNAVITNLNSS